MYNFFFHKIKFFKKTNYLLIIVFFYLLFLNLVQVLSQHWSSILDQDSVIIYNSLLVANGEVQEYLDHPSYTLFLLNSICLKILDLFNIYKLHNINSIIADESNFNNYFQKTFIILRNINLFIIFFSIYFFKNILKKLKFSPEQITLTIVIILSNIYFYNALFSLRSEPTAILFYLISLNFFILFNQKKHFLNLFFFSFFFFLAILAKIQIIIHFIFIFIFIFWRLKNFFIFKNKKKNKLNYLYIFIFFSIIISYLSIILFLEKNNRFEGIVFYEKYILLIILIIFYFLLKKNNFNYFLISEISKIFFLIFSGFFTCVILIFVLDITNIVPFNERIILRILLPIYYLKVFTLKEINPFQSLTGIMNSSDLASIIYLLTIIIYGTYFIINNFRKKIISKNNYILFLFLSLFLITVSFLFRGLYFYLIIYLSLIISRFIFEKKLNTFLKTFFFIFIINISINFSNNYDDLFKRTNNINNICNNIDTRNFVKYWHNKFDDKFLNKFCYIKQ